MSTPTEYQRLKDRIAALADEWVKDAEAVSLESADDAPTIQAALEICADDLRALLEDA